MRGFHQMVCIFIVLRKTINLTPETLFTQKRLNLLKTNILNNTLGYSDTVILLRIIIPNSKRVFFIK